MYTRHNVGRPFWVITRRLAPGRPKGGADAPKNRRIYLDGAHRLPVHKVWTACTPTTTGCRTSTSPTTSASTTPAPLPAPAQHPPTCRSQPHGCDLTAWAALSPRSEGTMGAVPLAGKALARLARRAALDPWLSLGTRPLRDSGCASPSGDITHPFVKWSPVAALKLRFVASTAARPAGFTKVALCQVPTLGRARQPSALPRSLRALRVNVWPPLLLSWWDGINQSAGALGQ